MIPVFRDTSIIQYDEKNADISWSYEEVLMASSFYATCVQKGIDTSLSYSLSYMYVMMKKHPDMSFSKTHMDMIDKIIINKDL
jgi:hypothetical protein